MTFSPLPTIHHYSFCNICSSHESNEDHDWFACKAVMSSYVSRISVVVHAKPGVGRTYIKLNI